jgi:O-antigen ligase
VLGPGKLRLACGRLGAGFGVINVNKTSLQAVLAGGILVTIVSAILLSLEYNVSPGIALVPLLGVVIVSYAVIRAPEVLLVAVIFMPQWKAYWPFTYVPSSIDLTIVALACLVACLLFRILCHIARLDSWGITQVFAGQGKVLLGHFMFAVMVAASYLYTTAPVYGGSKLSRFLGIGSVLLLAPLFLIRTIDDFRRFTKFFVASSAFTAVLLIAGLESHDTTGDITRIGGGWLVGVGLVVLLFFPLFRTESTQWLFVFAATPLFIAGLVASAARGPIVVLILMGLIRLVLWFREGKGHMAALVLLLVVGGGIVAFSVFRSASEGKYVHKTQELIELLQGNEMGGSAATRIGFYEAALGAIPDAPVFGRGIGSWSVFFFGFDERDYPHNILLEVAFEQGLLGLSLLGVYMLWVSQSVVWLWRRTGRQYSVLGLVILYCLGVAMFSGDLDDNRLLWFSVGITLAVCRTVKMQEYVHVPMFTLVGRREALAARSFRLNS